MADPVQAILHGGDLTAFLEAGKSSWRQLGSLRRIYGSAPGELRALAYDCGPDPKLPSYAFAAFSAPRPEGTLLQRSVVALWLERPVLVLFDLCQGSDRPAHWILDGAEDLHLDGKTTSFRVPGWPDRFHLSTVWPAAAEVRRTKDGIELLASRAAEPVFVHVLRTTPGPEASPLSGFELAGARMGEWVVLFHTESRTARSPLSFEALGGERVRVLLTGLAPGAWELWRNGWLEDPDGVVRPQAAALYFEARPGDFFLRRLG